MLVQRFNNSYYQKTTITENPKSFKEVHLINGQTTCASKCCGFCENSIHRGYINEKLAKEHDCINKECKFYYERIKEPVLKDKQALIKKQKNNENMLLSIAKQFLASYEGITVTGVSFRGDKYEIRYAQICNYDEIVKTAENEIQKTTGYIVSFVNIKGDFNVQMAAVFGF